jgi:hypothetical protein
LLDVKLPIFEQFDILWLVLLPVVEVMAALNLVLVFVKRLLLLVVVMTVSAALVAHVLSVLGV